MKDEGLILVLGYEGFVFYALSFVGNGLRFIGDGSSFVGDVLRFKEDDRVTRCTPKTCLIECH
jgi:hypothetical protein